jgi:hypothetical protein
VDDLTREDWNLILEALEYSKRAKAEYDSDRYPSYEFRQEQLARVDAVLIKARRARNAASGA